MRTPLTVAFALTTALVAACAGQDVPEHELRFEHDGEEVVFEELHEEFQELAYEVMDEAERHEPRPDGTVFRATCTAKCDGSTVSVTADHCTCKDYVGCSAQNGDGPIKSQPCPKKVDPQE